MQKIIKFEKIRKFKINRVTLSIILILLFIITLKSQSKLITTYFDSFLKNLGFGSGFNLGIKTCKTNYVLHLSPDVSISKKCIKDIRVLINKFYLIRPLQ